MMILLMIRTTMIVISRKSMMLTTSEQFDVRRGRARLRAAAEPRGLRAPSRRRRLGQRAAIINCKLTYPYSALLI